MFWWLWRFFWWPRYTYGIVVGKSHASADEAMDNALIQAQRSGGEVVGIAASALCCGAEEGRPSPEWDVYLLTRK
jgi:hypothetical protein